MFFFRKQATYESSGFFKGFADYHCHILPGVDDGVKTMDESLNILNVYERLGVHAVWCTPHVMEDVPNSTAVLQARYGELREAYKGPVILNLAAEYMLDGLFEERLKANDLLTLGNEERQVLVETSYFNAPINIEGTLRSIMSQGYFPVLAHPERYMYIDNMESYNRLIGMGVRLQLNIGSTVGMYGRTARGKAEMLLKAGAYKYMGTDLHNMDMLNTILRAKKSVHLP